MGVLAVVACGGTESEQSVDGLTGRAEAAFQAVSAENWAEFYSSYFSPESKKACPKDSFVANAQAGMLVLKEELEIGELDTFEIRVLDVEVEEDQGWVANDIYVNSEPFIGDVKPEDWTYLDGEWWYVQDVEDC